MITVKRAVRVQKEKPDLVLLDDPTVGLSKEVSDRLASFIHELREEGALRTVMMVSHDDRFLEKFNYNEVFLRNKALYQTSAEPEKKVANL